MVTRTKRCSRRSCRRALTLLELLIALAIASLVMLLAGGALRTTSRLVGDARFDEQRGTRESRVLTLLSAQIGWIRISDEGEAGRFIGTSSELELETLVSIRRPERREPVAARYRVERKDEVASIVYEEQPGRHGGAPEKGRVLLTGLKDVSFEYLYYEPGSGAAWREGWTTSALPRAIRWTITKEKGEPVRWVIPVVATF